LEAWVALSKIGRFFDKRQRQQAQVPAGTRLYVVGDVHGRADLLNRMFELIYDDIGSDRALNVVEIFIGDYVDRGRESRSVLEMLSSTPLLADRRICLKGNHEQMLLDFLSDSTTGPSWTEFGGGDTLLSYGVRPRLNMAPDEAERTRVEFQHAFPQGHYRFVRSLPVSFRCGDYFFAHAGVRPGVDLARQRPDDLLWIRDPFLGSTRNFGAIVVHGHTPAAEPVILPNRLCIDTGAFATGRLTCLVLEGTERRFLQTSRETASL
jgi:serine/threonine protein phosphatase 1